MISTYANITFQGERLEVNELPMTAGPRRGWEIVFQECYRFVFIGWEVVNCLEQHRIIV